MNVIRAAIVAAATTVGLSQPTPAGQAPDPQIKAVAVAENPAERTVLIGRSLAEDMIIQFELEPAKPMWMAMAARVQLEMDDSKGTWVLLTTPPSWKEHAVARGAIYHVEVKPIDPRSKTRIAYATVKFDAVNIDSGKRVTGTLHPMWGDSGLHYALNSGLSGDGTYEATITVEPPTFARALSESGRWMESAQAKFLFTLAGGKITHVTEPTTE